MKFLVAILVFILMESYVESRHRRRPPPPTCRCPAIHPQTKMCESDFVVRAIVRGIYWRQDAPQIYKIYYKIQIIKTFNGNLTVGTYYNLINFQSCIYRNLKWGLMYLVTGMWDDNGLSVGSCDWIQVSRRLTFHQRFGLEHSYMKRCQCQAGRDCKYDPAYSKRDCYFKYATCVEAEPKKCGICKWKREENFWRCCSQP